MSTLSMAKHDKQAASNVQAAGGGEQQAKSTHPVELYRALYDLVSCALTPSSPDEPSPATAEEQIRRILRKFSSFSSGFDQLVQWYIDSMEPALFHAIFLSAKQAATSAKYKQFADMYTTMLNDGEFDDKLFEYLNKMIIWAPSTECDLLIKAYLARSSAHQRGKAYAIALADLDRALRLAPHSLQIMERKVALLKRLDRHSEAYQYLDGLLSASTQGQSPLPNKTRQSLEQLRKTMKRFKHTMPTNIDKQQNECKAKDQKAIDDFTLQVHPGVKWALSSTTERPYLKAMVSINAGEHIVMEQPAMRADLPVPALKSFICGGCHIPCINSFIPCDACTEVIFCSEVCAAQANATHHMWECGILGALHKEGTIPAETLQVYRHLVLAGPRKLLDLDRWSTTFLPKLTAAANLTHAQALDWFFRASSDVRAQFAARRGPLLSRTELTSALYLVGIYLIKCIQLGIEPECLSTENDLIGLLRLLALEHGKTKASQFIFNASAATQLSAYQCLISSRIGHSCLPNVEWRLKDNTFVLIAKKSIAKGDMIVISYGVHKSDPFFVRLTHIRQYLCMCHCDLCMSDARRHFALRCTHCNGPIPFSSHPDPVPFTVLECLLCEQTFEPGLSKALTIEKDFTALQKSISLLRDVAEPPRDLLGAIEQKMAALASAMYTQNRALLAAIAALCAEYIRIGVEGQAVEWHIWLAGLGIHLPATKDEHDVQLDVFTRMHNLDEWIVAYLAYLPKLASGSQTNKYKEELRALFVRAYAVLGELNATATRVDLAATLAISPAQLAAVYNKFALKLDAEWRQFDDNWPDFNNNFGPGGQLMPLSNQEPLVMMMAEGAVTEHEH